LVERKLEKGAYVVDGLFGDVLVELYNKIIARIWCLYEKNFALRAIKFMRHIIPYLRGRRNV